MAGWVDLFKILLHSIAWIWLFLFALITPLNEREYSLIVLFVIN